MPYKTPTAAWTYKSSSVGIIALVVTSQVGFMNAFEILTKPVGSKVDKPYKTDEAQQSIANFL